MAKISSPYSLKNLFIYFFLLGTFGFGGAYTLANVTYKDLVERKKWITDSQFKQGLAFTQFAPGPLMTQLAMYIGFLKSNVVGAAVAGIAFFLTPGLSILGLTMLYAKYGDVSWIRNAFYTVNPAVIGIIIAAVISLIFKTIKKKNLWFILLSMFFISLITWKANYYLFLVAGCVSVFFNLDVKKKTQKMTTAPVIFPFIVPFATLPLIQLFTLFFSAGLIAFGGGFAILPYLQTSIVSQYHWLTNKQFLDGVAIAMITPGPVVLLSVFVGYFVGGLLGALIATLGIFIPAYLVVIIFAPILKKYSQNLMVKLFVDGVIAAALGAVCWVIITLSMESIKDTTTILFALAAIVAVRFFKMQSTWVVLLTGVLGVLFFHSH